ncbi:MAG: S8 family serine peptidase [Propionicimonas sp.]|uniref:S8 family serine peptidase n=1 Tax=Propionicimonas sp. TaxID=1955623 RepID=UPI003D0BB171
MSATTPEDLPAWAEPFHGPGPGPAPGLPLTGPVTRGWAYGDRSGRGVRVAVIDSGVDAAHPLVGGVAEYVAVSLDPDAADGVRVDAGEHTDLYGHGTACAAVIRSLAPAVELVSVRVLGANLRGSAVSFARGLEWCIEHGVTVANLSLSTTNERWFEVFHDLVDRASYGRMLIVSAMANERKRTIPSEFAGVFSVACGPGTDREQVWCNPSGPAEWGACGIDVEVAWQEGGTITASGNSFAAPVVAGHLARIAGAHPGITPWQARTVLAQLAANAPAR